MYIRPVELERRKLESIIANVFHKPLFIVAAPSGYGKTTIIKKTFHKHPEIKYSWLSLGHSEVDEVWVWRRLCETFMEYNPKLYKILTEIGLPYTVQEENHFISVLRENVTESVCVVIDDYHECNSHRINKLIERVAYEEIPNLHIMIVSRMFPDVACEEMFLKGYCMIVNQRMLALTKEETEEVFHINNIELTEAEKEKMYQYTDGWIAAVYLVLHHYMQSGKFEHLVNIGRLLKTAIYDKLSETMQEVCMKMSLFKSFTREEACYVTGKDISIHSLESMQEQFGFILFDTNTGSYILHTLLRSLAGSELEKKGLDKSEIFTKCGEYREKKGRYIHAIMCYRKAGKNEDILRILSGDKRNIIFEQSPGIIEDIFDSMSLDIKVRYPKAYLAYIYFIILKENAKKGKILYFEAADAIEKSAKEENNYRQLKGELLFIEALLNFNDLEKMNERFRGAYDLLDGHATDIFNHTLLTFGVPNLIILFHRESGKLKRTVELEKEYCKYHMRLVKGVNTDWDDLADSEYALIRNDIETAYTLSGNVLEKAAILHGGTCIIISSYYVRLRSLIHMGKEKEFYEVMAAFEERMKNTFRNVLVTDYELAYGYLYACIGRLEKIPDWLCKFDLGQCNRVIRNVRCECVVHGIMLCRMKKWVKLDAIADRMMMPYENTTHIYISIYGYLFKAIASLHIEGADIACKYLQLAVDLAKPDDIRVAFIENGSELMPLIELLAQNDEFCASLMDSIKSYQRALKNFERKKTGSLLTEREEELMQYVKAGMCNSEIGKNMHIALVTVEKNLTNIYRKLNVTNRVAAVVRMEEIRTKK